jgi:hypothetical protein
MSGPLTRVSLFSSRKIVYGTHRFFVFLAVAMPMIVGPVEAACGMQPFKPQWSNTLGGNYCIMASNEVTTASTLPTSSFYYANAFCGDGDTCCPQGYTPSCSGSGSNVCRGCVVQQATCTNVDVISTVATSGNSKTSVLQMQFFSPVLAATPSSPVKCTIVGLQNIASWPTTRLARVSTYSSTVDSSQCNCKNDPPCSPGTTGPLPPCYSPLDGSNNVAVLTDTASVSMSTNELLKPVIVSIAFSGLCSGNVQKVVLQGLIALMQSPGSVACQITTNSNPINVLVSASHNSPILDIMFSSATSIVGKNVQCAIRGSNNPSQAIASAYPTVSFRDSSNNVIGSNQQASEISFFQSKLTHVQLCLLSTYDPRCFCVPGRFLYSASNSFKFDCTSAVSVSIVNAVASLPIKASVMTELEAHPITSLTQFDCTLRAQSLPKVVFKFISLNFVKDTYNDSARVGLIDSTQIEELKNLAGAPNIPSCLAGAPNIPSCTIGGSSVQATATHHPPRLTISLQTSRVNSNQAVTCAIAGVTSLPNVSTISTNAVSISAHVNQYGKIGSLGINQTQKAAVSVLVTYASIVCYNCACGDSCPTQTQATSGSVTVSIARMIPEMQIYLVQKPSLLVCISLLSVIFFFLCFGHFQTRTNSVLSPRRTFLSPHSLPRKPYQMFKSNNRLHDILPAFSSLLFLFATLLPSAVMSQSPPITAGLIAHYNADSWTGSRWTDLSGAGNHVIDIGGSSISVARPVGAPAYIYGPSTAWIRFPVNILPSAAYTLFYVARYNGITRSRMFQGCHKNWYSGFKDLPDARTGVVMHESCGYYISDRIDTWLLGSDRSDSYRSNGKATPYSGSGCATSYDRICINTGYVPAETSDFAIQSVLVYNVKLSDADVQRVEAWLNVFQPAFTPANLQASVCV